MDTVNVLVDSAFNQKYPKYPLCGDWFVVLILEKLLKTLIYKHFTLYHNNAKLSDITNNDCCEAVLYSFLYKYLS